MPILMAKTINNYMSIPKHTLFPRLLRQLRAQILMYFYVHCGSARGASLLLWKNRVFRDTHMAILRTISIN